MILCYPGANKKNISIERQCQIVRNGIAGCFDMAIDNWVEICLLSMKHCPTLWFEGLFLATQTYKIKLFSFISPLITFKNNYKTKIYSFSQNLILKIKFSCILKVK